MEQAPEQGSMAASSFSRRAIVFAVFAGAAGVVPAFAIALLAACNSLVGLDDFAKVPETDGGDAGPDVIDAGPVLELPEGTLPATWVSWTVSEKVLGTKGISTDNGFDAGGNGVSAVLDNTTKHVWLVPTGVASTFADRCSITWSRW